MHAKILSFLLLFSLLGPNAVFAQNTLVSISRNRAGHFQVNIDQNAPTMDAGSNVKAILLRVPQHNGIQFRINPRSNVAELVLKQGPKGLVDTSGPVGVTLSYSIDSTLTIGGTNLAGSSLNAVITIKAVGGQTTDTTITLDITSASTGGGTDQHALTATVNPATPIYLPGNLYYDAKALLNPKTSQQEWDNILRYYSISAPAHQDILNAIYSGKNLFLKSVFKDTSHTQFQTLQQQHRNTTAGAQGLETTIQSLASGAGSGLGGLDVTNIADGVAKFMVKRAKEELTIAFFEKFKELIAKPQFVDLRTIFPNTYQALTIIGDQIYNYTGYIQTLRESFQKDLTALLANLPTVITNHPSFFNAHKDLAAILNSACYIGGDLRDKVHPGDILANYPVDYLNDLNLGIKGSVQTVQLLSFALKDSSSLTDSVYWVSGKKIAALVKDTTFFKTWLGLIYQKALTFDNNTGPIIFENNVSLDTIINRTFGDFSTTAAFVMNLGNKFDKLNTSIKQFKKSTNDSITLQQYTGYFTATIGLIQQCTQITTIKQFNHLISTDAQAKMNQLFDISNSAADLVLSISRRSYSSAIVDASHIYDVIKATPSAVDAATVNASATPSKTTKKLKKIVINSIKQTTNTTALANLSIQGVVNTNMTTADSAALSNKDTLANLQAAGTVKDNLFKFGSFMAAMVQAQNSNDVESVIEAFALPAGSSRIKRESPFNVSLNSYLGLYYGHEAVSGIKDGLAFNSYGVTAPIGIAISWGHSILFKGTGEDGWKNNKLGWSTSLFISLVDLGTIASYRISNDSVAQVPTIQLKDLFSPGAFISLGIPKTPVSLNFGAQFGPNLRSVASAQNSYEQKSYVRYSVSVLVDIPLLNLYTKSR
jgi:hypothetical protein